MPSTANVAAAGSIVGAVALGFHAAGPSGFRPTLRVSLLPTPVATSSMTSTPVEIPGIGAVKNVKVDTLVSPNDVIPIVDEAQRRVPSSTFDLNEASFIGELKVNSQRRPRGRDWVFCAKTTYISASFVRPALFTFVT